MTKADFIRKLATQGFTDLQILVRARDKFGFCSPSYVRTCARQRINGSSEHDKRYQASSLGRIVSARKNIAATRRTSVLNATGDLEKANAAGRKAYAAARAEGKSVLEGRKASWAARSKILVKTGNRALANAASRATYAEMSKEIY